MNKKKVIIIIAICLALVGLRACATYMSEQKQKASIQQSSIANVEVVHPFEVETSTSIESPGRIVAVETSDVVARIQGMILKQHYKDGDYVKKGQLLYTIDPAEFQIALQSAQANLESAKATQFRAQRDFERAKELVKNDYVSKSSYDQALATRNEANAAVKSCIAAVNDAKRLLSYTRVTAPISGKISKTDITVGNYLTSANTVLTKIVKTDPIYVTYSLDSAIFAKLKDDEIIPNQKQSKDIKVEITLPDGTVYDKQGNADFLDNVISETTGSITLRATFPNPDGRLIAGDFVNVKVYSNKTFTNLAVPQTAVLQDSSGRYLFKVDENNVAHKVKIVTNGQKDDNWLVVSGVTKEDTIVSSGVISLREGSSVRINDKKENASNKQEEKNKE